MFSKLCFCLIVLISTLISAKGFLKKREEENAYISKACKTCVKEHDSKTAAIMNKGMKKKDACDYFNAQADGKSPISIKSCMDNECSDDYTKLGITYCIKHLPKSHSKFIR